MPADDALTNAINKVGQGVRDHRTISVPRLPMRTPHPYRSAGWTYWAALAALALVTAAGLAGSTLPHP